MKIPILVYPLLGIAILVAYAFNDLAESIQRAEQVDELVAELRAMNGADGVVARSVADIWVKANPDPTNDEVAALELLVRKIKTSSDYGIEYIEGMRDR